MFGNHFESFFFAAFGENNCFFFGLNISKSRGWDIFDLISTNRQKLLVLKLQFFRIKRNVITVGIIAVNMRNNIQKKSIAALL